MRRLPMNPAATTNSHVYEIRPRKDKRGFDLIIKFLACVETN